MAKNRKGREGSKALNPLEWAAARRAEREVDIMALALFVAARTLRATRTPPEYIIDYQSNAAEMERLLAERYPGHLALLEEYVKGQLQDNANVIDLFRER